MKISKHPFEAFIPAHANRLIIGTIPPPRFCEQENFSVDDENDADVNFYYGSKDNDFWPIIGDVFNRTFDYKRIKSSIDQRKKFLEDYEIGITDIVDSCVRINNSALDRDISILKYKDLKNLLKNHDTVEMLIYTSEYVKKFMNEYFDTYHSINPINKKMQSIKIDGKEYQVRVLYSPSPRGLAGMGEGGKNRRIEQYRDFLSL